jgi:hypothetical protein
MPAEPKVPPLNKSRARTCLVVNALVCPGLGSLMGRRWSGIPQLILAWAGAIWMVWVLIRFFHDYIQMAQVPPDWRADRDAALGGFFIFMAGYVWSVATGASLLYRSRRPPVAPAGELPPKLGP